MPGRGGPSRVLYPSRIDRRSVRRVAPGGRCGWHRISTHRCLRTCNGKLGVPQNLSVFLTDQLQRNSFEILPVYLPHAFQVADLPDYHRDPFDRLLIAQALVQNMRIVSGDPQIHRYPVDVVW